MVLAHGFVKAQNVVETEAVSAAVRFVSELKQTNWTNDSVADVKILNLDNSGTIYEIVCYDGSSVLLSGRKECEPILGYVPSENNPFAGALLDHFDELPDGLKDLLVDYSKQIAYCNNHIVVSAGSEKWNRLLSGKSTFFSSSTILIQPLINTQWGQAKSNDDISGTYNDCCKNINAEECNRNCPAGCVAVAMAQIMKYWTFPVNIPWRCWQFDWINMPNQIFARDNPQYHTQKEATSKLIYNCGTSVHTIYCHDTICTSSVPYDSIGNVIIALRDTFGYSESMELKYRAYETDWESLLINELQQNRPLFYFGTGTGGHAFVCDGCFANPDQQFYCFHFNWGWTGTADGYFVLNALKPYDGYQIHNYSNNQGAVFNIQPSACFQNIIMECDKNFTHTAIKSFSAVYDFSNNFHIYNINSGAIIHVQAGNEILLTDGFYAQQGSSFQATITPCSSPTNFLPDYFGNEVGEDTSADTLAGPKSLHTETTDIPADAALSVYPNPAGDLLHIELSGGGGIASVALYDLQGRVVTGAGAHAGTPQPGTTTTVNLRNVPAGVYLLRVRDAEGKEYYSKIVKR